MAEKIWVSDSALNSSIISKLSVVPDIMLPTVQVHDLTRLDTLQKKYHRGEGLSEDERYKSAFGWYRETRIKTLPDFFMVNGFFVVSVGFAEVLNKFDLGKTELSSIDLFQGNRRERINGDWFFLDLGSVKQAFLPEASTGGYAHPDVWPEGRWIIRNPKDDELAVSSSALEGSDLWIDPLLNSALFLSGRLEAALKGAKMTRTLRRARCSVVGDI